MPLLSLEGGFPSVAHEGKELGAQPLVARCADDISADGLIARLEGKGVFSCRKLALVERGDTSPEEIEYLQAHVLRLMELDSDPSLSDERVGEDVQRERQR